MKDWIIFALAFSQIVVLYWISTRSCLGMINKIFLDKNTAWVLDNPDFYARFAKPKLTVYLLYGVGALWLLGLSSIMGKMDDTSLFLFLGVPNSVWQMMLMVYLGVAYFRIAKKIPLPTKRSANLARRNLRDYVHPFWTGLCVASYLIVIASYVAALTGKHIELEVFVRRMAYLAFVLLLTVGLLRYSLRRKRNFLDDVLGASFRRWEVLANFTFSMMASAFVVLWIMIHDLTSTLLISPISVALAWSLVCQALVLYLTFHTRIKQALAKEVPVPMTVN
jgi:hypothetical protein